MPLETLMKVGEKVYEFEIKKTIIMSTIQMIIGLIGMIIGLLISVFSFALGIIILIISFLVFIFGWATRRNAKRGILPMRRIRLPIKR